MVKARVFISGMVQGVFYRAWTKRTAQSLNLSGWVKNRSDGRVEAVFVGEKEKVEKMIELLHQGSPASSVDQVKVAEKERVQTDIFNSRFEIRR